MSTRTGPRWCRSGRGLRGTWFSAAAVALLVACSGPTPEPAPQTLPAETGVPARIVSGVVDSDEVLWALGPEVRARVVGVSPMVDDARYSSVADVWPTTVARVPGTSEAMLVSNPDLVIVAAFSAPETRALLEHTGVPTLVLERFDGFDDYRSRVTKVATAVGAPQRGEELVAAFNARLPVLPLGKPATRTVLSYASGNVAGSGTSFADVAAAAGLVNLPGREGIRGHKAVTIEQILVWDPDFLVIDCAGDCARAKQELGATPGFATSRAIKEQHVLAMSSRRLYSAGAAMADLAVELRSAVEDGS